MAVAAMLESMSRFRPRMRVMGIAAAVVLVGALALRTDLGAAPGLPAPPAVLTPSQPVPVLVADKPAPRAYVWSATRIESSIRLRGAAQVLDRVAPAVTSSG